MRWATRSGPHVDRTACAWLIRRFVDPEAEFEDDRFDAPEAPGLDALMRGLSLVRDDHDVLAISAPLYDGLYAYLQRAATS